MAAYTVAKTGNVNWSDPTTWSPNGVPGAGDTVTNSLAAWLIVDVNVIIGAGNGKYVSGGNPAAIALGSSASGIYINPGIKLTVRGDITFAGTGAATRGIRGCADAVFEWDSSTTSPTTTSYGWIPTANGVFSLNISSENNPASPNKTIAGHPFTIQSNPGGANGGFASNGFFGYGALNCVWTVFKNIGSATVDCWEPCFTDSNFSVSLTDCVFDTCGQINFIEVSTNSSWVNAFTRVTFKNSLGGWNVRNNGSFATFDHCVFDKNVDTGNSTYTHCYFGAGYVSGRTAQQWSFSDNIVLALVGNAGYNTQGGSDGSYWIGDTNQPNVHYAILNEHFAPVWTNNTFEYTGSDGSGDGIMQEGSANPVSGAGLATITGNLVLPNAAGENVCDLINGGESTNSVGRVWDARNNTVFAGSQGLSQDSNNAAGSFEKVQNNIIWDYAGKARGYVLQDTASLNASSTSGLTEDIVSPANIGKNCTINLQWTYPSTPGFVNQANGYQYWFSSTPGATDIHVDPAFFDSTRTFATFSRVYLGSVAGSSWASHASTDNFVVGQIVSNNNAIFYGGIVINFRCIVAHAKSTTGSEPGGSFTSAWRTYWEFESLYLLRQAIGAGTTYTDATLGITNATPIQTLQAWVRRGYAPTNQALKAAGTDGTDIGAVPVYTAGSGGSTNNQRLTLLGIG